jgi:hypothetical protein
MQLDIPSIPHNLAQVLWIVLASSLGWVGGWLTRRKREPVEIEKLRAETKQIHVTAENSQTSVGLETLREIQSVIQKAEQRREEWTKREEELRTQTRFWRSKAEELDGDLVELREAFGLLQKENASYENQLRTMELTLKTQGKNYDNSQDVGHRDYQLPEGGK